MSNNTDRFGIFLLVLLSVSGRWLVAGQGYFTEIPINMAAVMGSEVQFNCSANVTSDVLEWSHLLNGSDSTRIYDTFSGKVLDSRFDVITSTMGGYYLVIKSASPDVGGPYRCLLFVANTRANCEFVALSEPRCSPEPGSREVEEGVVVTMSCEADFYGYRDPDLQWSSELGTYVGLVSIEANRVKHTFNVSASGRHHEMDFNCQLLFANRPSEPSAPPTFTTGCSTHFTVLFGAENVEVNPDPDNEPGGVLPLMEGDVINCTADGNPEPELHWENGDEYINDWQLVITDSMADGTLKVYTCIAQNFVNGAPRTASKEVQFVAENVEPTNPPGDDTGDTLAAGAIAGIVIGCIVLVVIVIVIILLLLRRRNGNKANESEPPPPYTSSGQPYSHRPSGLSGTATQRPPANPGMVGALSTSRDSGQADLGNTSLGPYFPTGIPLSSTPNAYRPTPAPGAPIYQRPTASSAQYQRPPAPSNPYQQIQMAPNPVQTGRPMRGTAPRMAPPSPSFNNYGYIPTAATTNNGGPPSSRNSSFAGVIPAAATNNGAQMLNTSFPGLQNYQMSTPNRNNSDNGGYNYGYEYDAANDDNEDNDLGLGSTV